MYAVLNPDGSFHEIRAGEIDERVNTTNRQKRYAVPYAEMRPALQASEQLAFVRRAVTPDGVIDHYRAEPIPPAPPTLESRIAAIEARLTAVERR